MIQHFRGRNVTTFSTNVTTFVSPIMKDNALFIDINITNRHVHALGITVLHVFPRLVTGDFRQFRAWRVVPV